MELPKLTTNGVQVIHDGDETAQPVLQITQMKRMNPEDTALPRFKLALTDGVNNSLAMATGAAADLLPPFGKTEINSIVKLINYQRSVVNGKTIIILLDFQLLMPGSKIGHSLMKENSDNRAVPPTTVLTNGVNRPVSGQVSSRPQMQPNVQAHSNVDAFKNIHPIDSLTPYQNKWCIRARVTDKRPIKTYKNARGDGKLFSVDLADNSGAIRATGFNQECDRFYDLLQEGQVYYMRGGQIKAANKQFSSLPNDYELTFSTESQIDQCRDEVADAIPTHQFSFIPFNQLQDRSKETLIDVIGVIDTVSQCETIVSKQSQKEFRKRNIRLIDDTQHSVSLTLWGDEAENFESKLSPDNLHPVLAAKGVRISDFQGVSLSMTFGGKVIFNPERQEAYRLRGWYDNKGSETSFQNLSSMTSGGGGGAGSNQFTLVALADAQRLGTGEKPDYFTIKGTISALKRDQCLYQACPSADCKKKLMELGVDSYRCEKCNKEFSNFKWRLMLSAQLQDYSGQVWVTFFEDMAQSILGYSSEELGEMRKQDEDAFNEVLNKCQFKTYAVKLRAKMETFNDETRVKFSCVKIDPMKYDEYVRYLEEDIKKLESLPAAY